MKAVYENLPHLQSPHWRRHEVVNGVLEPTENSLLFLVPEACRRCYSNAQIDDYKGLPTRRHFPWRPPLCMTVRARFSHNAAELKGTAGFGFWNDPFGMTERRVPTLPQAIWFFSASPHNNMKLDVDAPGCGWKAATIDAARPASLLLALLAPPAILLVNYPPLFRALWPHVQRRLKIKEAVVEADMTEWHTYVIDWGTRQSRFLVDGRPVGRSFPAPRGPLGFVMWLDNQYMVVTPWGRFWWGRLEAPEPQWMEVDYLAIEPR